MHKARRRAGDKFPTTVTWDHHNEVIVQFIFRSVCQSNTVFVNINFKKYIKKKIELPMHCTLTVLSKHFDSLYQFLSKQAIYLVRYLMKYKIATVLLFALILSEEENNYRAFAQFHRRL